MKAIIIEQSADEARLAFEVHRHAQMGSIRLAHATFCSWRADQLSHEPVRLSFDFRAEQGTVAAGILTVIVAFKVTANPSNRHAGSSKAAPSRECAMSSDPSEAPLAVEAAFEADYILRDGYEPPEEAIAAFQNGNAIFNTWPYFREFLQSATTRMGHPPLTAPFLKLLPQRAKPQKATPVAAQVAPEQTPSRAKARKRPASAK